MLPPQVAGRLAGKLPLLTQAVFRALGKSAMQHLFTPGQTTQLVRKTTDHMDSDPLVNEHLQAVVFADVYVRVGETAYKVGHIPADAKLPRHAVHDNSWGYVVRIGTQVFYNHRKTPTSVLKQITSTKQFIYAWQVCLAHGGPHLGREL